MRGTDWFWRFTAVLATAGLAILGVIQPSLLPTTALGLVLFLGVLALGQALSRGSDRKWLTKFVAMGMVAKLIGSGLRYLMVVGLYESGDALRYHRAGVAFVEQWRSFQIPKPTSPGAAGTHLVEQLTGLLYVPYAPTLLGGFLIFGTLSFLGQLGLYAAFRRALPPTGHKTYAALTFFLPSLVFWPASIGKEALMLLAIGLFAVGAAGLLTEYRFRWIVPASAGILGAAFIRPHIGFLMVASLGLATLFGRRPMAAASRARRWALIMAAGFVVTSLLTFVGERYDIRPDRESLETFTAEVVRTTGQGGSEIEGEPVDTPLDVPGALLRVLFRPLPFEAHNSQAMLSAVESLAILGLVVWRLPYVWRNVRSIRRYPYLLMASVFVLGFAVIFSPVLNLGILARQRSQALGFVLAVIVGMGWRKTPIEESRSQPVPAELVGG